MYTDNCNREMKSYIEGLTTPKTKKTYSQISFQNIKQRGLGEGGGGDFLKGGVSGIGQSCRNFDLDAIKEKPKKTDL